MTSRDMTDEAQFSVRGEPTRAGDTTGPQPPGEPATAVCAAMYYADLVPAYAFIFRVAATDTRFTVYARTGDSYLIGQTYTMLITPSHTPALPLTVEDCEFLRSCLHNTAHRWREAIAEADAGANQPHQPHPAAPGYLNVEPTPAGYQAARRLFGDELDRVERLDRLLDQHLAHLGPATRTGDQQ